MSAEDEFERFVVVVGVSVSYRAVLTGFVDLFHVLEILIIVLLSLLW